jgi:hypothetical protein
MCQLTPSLQAARDLGVEKYTKFLPLIYTYRSQERWGGREHGVPAVCNRRVCMCV